MKITNKTELMFSAAVALAQNGRMKSQVHCKESQILIQNMDNTILLKFLSDMTFPEPLSFFANDYSSPEVETRDGQVVFISQKGGYRQEQAVGAPKTTQEEVQAVWDKHPANVKHGLVIRKDALSLLDDSLSHTEFHQEGKTLKLVQKNIYTGARIEITDTQSSKGFISAHSFPEGFAPIGIRTSDLQSLFSFVDTLTFYPQPVREDGAARNWMYFNDSSGIVEGLLSTCLYDELGYLTQSEES